MQRELESGYMVETSERGGAFLVRVYDPVGVHVAVRHGMQDEESAMFVGEAMADAYCAGFADGRERIASRVRALVEKHNR